MNDFIWNSLKFLSDLNSKCHTQFIGIFWSVTKNDYTRYVMLEKNY